MDCNMLATRPLTQIRLNDIHQSHPRGSIHEQLEACLVALDGNRSHQLGNDSVKSPNNLLSNDSFSYY